MGKASTSKKVARVAGTGGGRTGSSNTPWSYIGLIALIVVVGMALTYTSRHGYYTKLHQHHTKPPAAAAPKIGGTPWNAGLAVYICGKWQPPVKRTATATGLTAEGNGVIHIAPKVKEAAGANATLGEWGRSVGVHLTARSIRLPGGRTYRDGDRCGGQRAQLYVKQFPYVGAAAGTLLTASPPHVKLSDGVLYTVAFVPPAQRNRIPAPPQKVQEALKRVIAATTTTTTAPSTTVPATTTTKPAPKASRHRSTTPTTSAGTSHKHTSTHKK